MDRLGGPHAAQADARAARRPPERVDDRSTSRSTIELTDLNEPQTIEAPATSRPLDELLGQLQGLLGGALGGGRARRRLAAPAARPRSS